MNHHLYDLVLNLHSHFEGDGFEFTIENNKIIVSKGEKTISVTPETGGRWNIFETTVNEYFDTDVDGITSKTLAKATHSVCPDSGTSHNEMPDSRLSEVVYLFGQGSL